MLTIVLKAVQTKTKMKFYHEKRMRWIILYQQECKLSATIHVPLAKHGIN
jgi:hypothetical protein